MLPVNIWALQQQLGDALGLRLHLLIALLDIVHEVGAHTGHRIIGQGVDFFEINFSKCAILHDGSLNLIGSILSNPV